MNTIEKKITIIHNDKPHLDHAEMLCDGGLHNKLNNYELTKFLNNHSNNLFIGRPGSGKTSLVYSLFKSSKVLKKVFHTVYLFQPAVSRQSMKDKLFDELPATQKFEELTLENLNNVFNAIKASDRDMNKCIIFDDMTAYLKNADTLKLLKELVFNSRHLRVSIFFMCQTWFSVPKDIRKLFSNIFVFRVSKIELKSIFDEVVESKASYINEISKMVYDRDFKYLCINVNSQRLFDGFDELIIEE